jgi:hypothetical protein
MGFYTTNNGLIGTGQQSKTTGVHNLTRSLISDPGQIVYLSRNSSVTEGVSSNYTTSAGMVGSPGSNYWAYGGNSTDAITITTTGKTATLNGFTIGNYVTPNTNSLTGLIYIASGSNTNGSQIKSTSFSGIALSTGVGQTMIRFSSGAVLPPGVYTIGFAWGASQTIQTCTQASSVNRGSSTFNGFTVTYVNALFGAPSPYSISNGTSVSPSGQNGQVVTMEWVI